MKLNLARHLPTNNIHVVGGAVRDRLLGRPVLDIDLITPIDPTKMANTLANELNGSAFPLDEKRGIVRVKLPDGVVDFAKWQGKTLEQDIDRRDFTVNALTVPLDTWERPNWKKFIIDRHSGLRDLKSKKIGAVSPSVFKDDPLRLLRAFRIAAELGFDIPAPTRALISKNKNLIRKPAPERVREELLKLFATNNSYRYLKLMDTCGLLEKVFPEANALRKTAPNYYGKGGVLKHTLDSVKCFEEILADRSWFPGLSTKINSYLAEKIGGHLRLAHCKWGLLLHDIGKPATMKMIDGRLRFFEHEHVGAEKVGKLAKRFRWSSDETSRYANYVRHHMRPGNLASHDELTDKAMHRFFRDLGEEAIAMLLISLGDHLTYLTAKQKRARNSAHEKVTIKMVRRYYMHREKIVPPKLLTGYDVMKAFNLKPSPLIGALLNDLTEAQTEHKINSKEEALSYLKERLPWHQEKLPKTNSI